MSNFYKAEMIEKNQSVNIIEDKQGLCLLIETSKSTAKLSLFGSQVLSFISKQDGRERFWVSQKAVFDGKTPIRGGMPICWPWFSTYSSQNKVMNTVAPNHGFVRSQFWHLQSVNETYEKGPNAEHPIPTCKSVTLTLVPTNLGLFGFSHDLNITLKVELSEQLIITLITKNNSLQSITITQALHSYFAVPDVLDLIVTGISEPYLDKLSNTEQNLCPNPYYINQETDRIHGFEHLTYTQKQTIILRNKKVSENVIQDIEQLGHDSIVVWNPWQTLSKSMKDMDNDGYQSMLCIEAANIQPLTIKPGEQHQLTQIIK